MLSQAIGDLLPTAVGVALSPIPIVAVIVMLGTPRARSNGPAFVVGWITGLVAVSAVVLALTGADASNPDSTTSTGINWVQVVIGVALLVLAARRWRARPKAGEEPTLPKWMAAVDTFTPVRSLGLGVALSAANPKNLALTLAAAASIAQAGLDGGQDAVAVAVYVVIASVTVAGPVIFYAVASSKASAPLATVKDFMATHNSVILVVILLIFGAKLLGQGLGALGS